MPHLTLEYSQNLTAKVRAAQLTQVGHKVMIDSGLFNANDIKSRSYEVVDYQVGENGSEGSFVHATARLLAGRTVEQRKALSDALFDVLGRLFPEQTQVTVEIVEMDRDTYKKRQPVSV